MGKFYVCTFYCEQKSLQTIYAVDFKKLLVSIPQNLEWAAKAHFLFFVYFSKNEAAGMTRAVGLDKGQLTLGNDVCDFQRHGAFIPKNHPDAKTARGA